MKTSKESDQVKLARVIALSEIKKLRGGYWAWDDGL